MDRKPRILQICHDYKGPFRTVARLYAGCFADCDVRTIFLRGRHSADLAATIHGEVDFLNLETGALRGLKLDVVSKLKSMIADEPPDIVIAHRYKPLFVSILLNRQLEIGLVLGVMHEFGFLKRWTRSLFSRFWPDNVQLLGVSPPVCEEVRQTQKHLKERVHLLPHAIEAGTLLDSVSARHQLGIPLGKYCYGVIGRLVAKKNHELLIDAIARLEDDSVVALVGDGELAEKLKDQARRLRVSDRVVFCGHHEDAKRLMKAFDAFVLSSTEEEAFGIVLLEAMAASLPVLTSNAPGPVSVVGDAAITFRSGDVEDLTRGMKEVQAMTRQQTAELTGRALERLGAQYSVATMMKRLRGLPAVAELAPVTM